MTDTTNKLPEKTARIPWPQLGWGLEPPLQNDALIALIVISPWCEDCRDWGRKLQGMAPERVPIWLVGEFAPKEDILAYAREFDLPWPVLFGTSEKTDIALSSAHFRDLRTAWGDTRTWGVPLWIEGRISNGWLEVAEMSWPD